jgi:capsular exopolysaccharide family
MNEQQINNFNQEDEFSFVEVFFHYFRHWKWFLASCMVCVAVVFIYLRYANPEYKVVAKILIRDDKKGQAVAADFSAFSDLGLVANSSNLDNEIEVLRSKTLRTRVKNQLNLGVTYVKEGRVKQSDIYTHTPVFVYVVDQLKSGRFTLSQSNENTMTLHSEEEAFSVDLNIPKKWENPSKMVLMDTVVSPWGILSFEINPLSIARLPVTVVLSDPKSLPDIQVVSLSKTSSVVEVSIIEENPQKGKDIVNALIQKYNDQVIEDQTYVASNSIKFINDRLQVISGELKSAELDVERYMQEKGVTDLQAQAQSILSSSTEYDQKISDAQIQLNIIQSLKQWFLTPENNGEIAPSNIGLTGQTVLNLMNRYNEEILEKNRITVGMTENNPTVQEYNTRITSLRDDLIKGINLAESSMQTNLRELQRKENVYLDKARNLPTQERESRELYRQQSTKESLALYLMQKYEETGLSLAMAVPNAAVIDSADYSNVPVKPKKSIIYLAALLLGVIIPVIVIYIRDLFDNKIHSKEDVQRTVKAPFLGDIPESTKDQVFPVKNVRSAIAEKFRIILSNLRFIIGESKNKVIMVTSIFSTEGKSFFSRNLAYSLASSGNRVLLIDIDMRKSMLDKTLEMNAQKGIAYYLSNPRVSLEDVIDPKEFHPNLNIIPVKVFPPNPAELMASSRLNDLLGLARESYDYVIVDTAPIGLVADAFRVNEFADTTIFVTRAEVTYKESLKEIQSYCAGKKLTNITTVLNAVPKRKGYGYGDYKHNYYVEED